MKVLLINGSPNEKGCTYTALSEVAAVLEKEGITAEICHVGKKPIAGCIACGSCIEKGRCVFDDQINEILARLSEIDGIVLGSPVYYAAASGQIATFANRLFFAGQGKFHGKLGASVVSCRRGGASATFDQLNKFFTISGMPVASSSYWNQVHGNTPDEVRQDLEGLQTMRNLGRNMAWLLKSIESGKKAGLLLPDHENDARTNFIR